MIFKSTFRGKHDYSVQYIVILTDMADSLSLLVKKIVIVIMISQTIRYVYDNTYISTSYPPT